MSSKTHFSDRLRHVDTSQWRLPFEILTYQQQETLYFIFRLLRSAIVAAIIALQLLHFFTRILDIDHTSESPTGSSASPMSSSVSISFVRFSLDFCLVIGSVINLNLDDLSVKVGNYSRSLLRRRLYYNMRFLFLPFGRGYVLLLMAILSMAKSSSNSSSVETAWQLDNLNVVLSFVMLPLAA